MLYVTSSSFVPQNYEGLIYVENISLEEARDMLNTPRWVSSVGHESTARIMTTLLNQEIEQNRIMIEAQSGDSFLIFSLNGRPPEGEVLDREGIEEIGYSFRHMQFLHTNP